MEEHIDKSVNDEHLEKLFKKYSVAMSRWEIAFNSAGGRLTTLERELSKKAYWAYCEWKKAEGNQ
jgi:hypothetical protein